MDMYHTKNKKHQNEASACWGQKKKEKKERELPANIIMFIFRKPYIFFSLVAQALLYSTIADTRTARPLNFLENVPNSLEVVLAHGEKITDGGLRYYHSGKCRVLFSHDGRFRSGPSAGQDSLKEFRPGEQLYCDGQIMYKMQEDGNFVFRCNGKSIYSTKSWDGDNTDYKYVLAIDSNCYLHIYRGTIGCNKFDLEAEAFNSDRFVDALKPGDVIGLGEAVHFSDGFHMKMESDIFDVAVYDRSWRYAEWRASDQPEWSRPGYNVGKFHADITRDGFFKITGFDLDTLEEVVIFMKDLQTHGRQCFNVRYDDDIQDIVADRCY